MSDFTSTNLEAALLDQIVAGAFPGKRYAFAEVCEGDAWKLGVAVANEPGYHPCKRVFKSQDEAREWADGLNEHIGLDRRAAALIIASTMGGRRVA
jgi:hypothetical protein